MDLPHEIRNQIYSYLFSPIRVQVHRIKDPKTKRYRLKHILIAPRDPATQSFKSLPHKNKTNGSADNFQTRLSLPFVSKQTYQDTICLLYENTQFVFTTLKSITWFLRNTPMPAQAAIQHIGLHHTMYNEPRLTFFRQFKLKSDKSWYTLCETIAKNVKARKVVHIDLRVFDAPIKLEVGESWSLPILVLGRRTGPGHGEGTLRFAKVKLACGQFKDEKVREVEWLLEKELMDPVAMQMREDEKLARELAGQVQGKVLRLVFG